MPVEIARAKINLALHILGRREDGFHALDSIVAFADIGDSLSFDPATHFELVVDGSFAGDVPIGEDNLVLRAARALGESVVPARIVLTKNLPVASGIGGGSADAAAVIRGLMKLSGKPFDPRDLLPLARSIGADVPVCLFSQACRMTGTGEKIAPIDGFEPLNAVLVNPMTPVATATVFAELGLANGQIGFTPIHGAAPAGWRNDLEAPALRLAPVISDVLRVLRQQQGLSVARMSGSGATCFGLFENRETAAGAAAHMRAAHPRWWIQTTVLR